LNEGIEAGQEEMVYMNSYYSDRERRRKSAVTYRASLYDSNTGKHRPSHKATAAAKIPTKPIMAIAVGAAPAGARPVLGVTTAPDWDLEGDVAAVPVFEPVEDGPPLAEADPAEDAPVAVTNATT
jgi:hypothetical protein